LTDLSADLRLSLAQYETGEPLRDLNVIESPPQTIRDSFDLMPTESADDWEVLASRLRAVPAALAGYRLSLAEGVSRGTVPAIRQVTEVAAQARRTADSFFGALVSGANGNRPGLETELEAA